jgi:hypothetical protein
MIAADQWLALVANRTVSWDIPPSAFVKKLPKLSGNEQKLQM